MPTFNFVGYSPDALVYDGVNNTWALRPDYDPLLHRVSFEITDDDAYLGGDNFADEVGNDFNQTAVVSDMSGTPVASGQVYDEEFYVLNSPTVGSIWVERVEIGGQHVGYLVSAPLDPGVTYPQTTTMDAADNAPDADVPQGNTAPYSSFTDVPCFVRGTMIATPEGMRPVEHLRIGDLVTNQDGRAQPIRWISARHVGPKQLAAQPGLRPIALEAGWTGCARRILLSPQHGVLIKTPDVPAVRLARATHLARLRGGKVRMAKGVRRVTYVHFMLPRHQIVFADGLATETFYPGPQAVKSLSPFARLSLLAQFPEHDGQDLAMTYGQPCAPYTRLRELKHRLDDIVAVKMPVALARSASGCAAHREYAPPSSA